VVLVRLRLVQGLDVSELPGVTVYGATPEEPTLKANALALRVIAEEIEPGEMPAAPTRCSSPSLHERMARHEGSARARGTRADRVAQSSARGVPTGNYVAKAGPSISGPSVLAVSTNSYRAGSKTNSTLFAEATACPLRECAGTKDH
jgi:hypothetical protein